MLILKPKNGFSCDGLAGVVIIHIRGPISILDVIPTQEIGKQFWPRNECLIEFHTSPYTNLTPGQQIFKLFVRFSTLLAWCKVQHADENYAKNILYYLCIGFSIAEFILKYIYSLRSTKKTSYDRTKFVLELVLDRF
jgi:hypothetical protein